MSKVYISQYMYNLHKDDIRYLQSFVYCHFVNMGEISIANKMWDKISKSQSDKDAFKILMYCYIGIR